MTLTLYYGAVFGKGDSSDPIEWEVELDEKEEAIYKRALMTDTPFDDVPELNEICYAERAEIEAVELENFRDMGDEYTLECLGENEVDPDELTELVRSRDPHALAFFNLQDASDSEIAEWDAEDLDELPLIKDFQEGFEPVSPFDCGWYLNVWIPEPDEGPDDSEIEDYLREVLTTGDVALAEAVVKAQVDTYDGDLHETTLKIAVQVGCNEYIESHRDDVDL